MSAHSRPSRPCRCRPPHKLLPEALVKLLYGLDDYLATIAKYADSHDSNLPGNPTNHHDSLETVNLQMPINRPKQTPPVSPEAQTFHDLHHTFQQFTHLVHQYAINYGFEKLYTALYYAEEIEKFASSVRAENSVSDAITDEKTLEYIHSIVDYIAEVANYVTLHSGNISKYTVWFLILIFDFDFWFWFLINKLFYSFLFFLSY